MPACEICGDEHELLDPAFKFPDAYAELENSEHARATSDVCRIALPAPPGRCFVRGVLPVRVDGLAEGLSWGLWAELTSEDFRKIGALWNDPLQSEVPPFAARLANRVPLYAATTIGLRLQLQLESPPARPTLTFDPAADHPFARECREGVSLARAHEWADTKSWPRVEGSR